MADDDNKQKDEKSENDGLTHCGDSNFVQIFLIHVELVAAHDLKKADFTGKSDPYCSVQAFGRKYTTKTIMKNLNPVWNETTDFTFFNDPKSLHFEVWDWDKGTKNDSIGDVDLSLNGFYDDNHNGFQGKLKLENVKKGEIEIKVTARKLLPAQLENKAKDLTNQCEQNNEKIIEQNNEMKQLKNDFNECTERINDYKAKIEDLERKIPELQSNLDALKTKEMELQSEKEELNKNIETQKGKLGDLENEEKDIDSKTEEVEGKLKELNIDIDNLQKEIGDLKAKIKEKEEEKRRQEERERADNAKAVEIESKQSQKEEVVSGTKTIDDSERTANVPAGEKTQCCNGCTVL